MVHFCIKIGSTTGKVNLGKVGAFLSQACLVFRLVSCGVKGRRGSLNPMAVIIGEIHEGTTRSESAI